VKTRGGEGRNEKGLKGKHEENIAPESQASKAGKKGKLNEQSAQESQKVGKKARFLAYSRDKDK